MLYPYRCMQGIFRPLHCSPFKSKHMVNASIEEFICRYFSLQQTALVDNMLYEDRHMEMYNYVYNQHMHSVTLSSDTFTGTHNQLMAKKAELQQQLQEKRSPILKRDIELLETAQGKIRVVYEWYAVPYWIARHMIDNNEVVLSWKDCYWWGSCDVVKPLGHVESIKSLFESLGTF